jgi:hypothetical protein
MQKIVANPDGKQGWREYRNVADVPELDGDSGGTSAVGWIGGNGDVLISTQEPGQDFAAYTDYCFDSKGQLIQMRYELRTAWGWGYREEGPISKGVLVPQVTEFFDTKTEAPINRPEDAASTRGALTPRLYLQESNLPFFKLLSKK